MRSTVNPVEKEEKEESLHRSLLSARLAYEAADTAAKGKIAENAPPVSIGWDSHAPIVSSETSFMM